MAFRFKREGDFVKNYVHWERTGIRPWMDDFKWRATEWHYKFAMGPVARNALKSNQEASEKLQYMMDAMHAGEQSSKFPWKTKRFYFRTALPNVVPYRKSSNPFCPVTPNKSGWSEWNQRIRPNPAPAGHAHEIGGTDFSVPVFPKFK
eukprot:GDKI01039450.1.p1 GENE.GDKI01039450.1~~GDKI01039450.1.p1  ORF type:complete len:148 (-),score=36.75 GDKI01039450.1:270-713(-)